MKALTICQPYAELIIRGEKLVENRTWPGHLRGLLLIHAGQSRSWLDSYEPLPDRMDFGALIGFVRMIACVRAAEIATTPGMEYLKGHKHVEGPFCFVLQTPVRFEAPIPYRGMQGFFHVPDPVIDGEILKGTFRPK